jgi:hypothetical protein
MQEEQPLSPQQYSQDALKLLKEKGAQAFMDRPRANVAQELHQLSWLCGSQRYTMEEIEEMSTEAICEQLLPLVIKYHEKRLREEA